MGYTEEEMHELEVLAHLEEKDFDHNTCDNSYIDLVMNAGKKAFKIINKQQKEIERLERINKDYDLIYTKQYEYIQDCISKKVIREKIEKLQKRLKYYEELDLPEIDENGVRIGIIKEEEILTSRVRILVLKELLGE